jgi:hypothetical protein
MPLPQPEANPLAGRIFEQEVATILRRKARSKSADKQDELARQIVTLIAAATLHEVLLEVHAQMARREMVEQTRREAEVELLVEVTEEISYSFPDDYLKQRMAPRFFELLADTARCVLAATKESHPVTFRALLNDGWRCVGRAEEVAWSMEWANDTGYRSGTKTASRDAKALRAALLEGTATGTIEDMAERHNMSPRNVSYIKASIRKRQAI